MMVLRPTVGNLLAAAERGDEEAVRLCLQHGVEANATEPGDLFGYTALIVAAGSGHKGVVEFLLRAGANPNLPTSTGDEGREASFIEGHFDFSAVGRTALIAASARGQVQIVKALLDHGADVSAADGDGQSPLMFAAYNGDRDVVELLLQHCVQVNQCDRSGRAALWYAENGAEDPQILSILAAAAAIVGEPTFDFDLSYDQLIVTASH